MTKHVVIIGNGISGITAARNIRKRSNFRISVISSETKHFFSRTALMYVYMGHMRYENTKPYEDWFWTKNRIDLLEDKVIRVDPGNKSLQLEKGGLLSYDILIIAAGSRPNKFGWPGQDLKGVHGLYSKQDLDMLEERTSFINRGVVVGGGLIGIELAEMLLSRKKTVTFLVREESFWNRVLPSEESEMINRIIKSHNIDLRLNTELREIIGNNDGEVTSVITKDDRKIECQFVGLTVGVSPNIEFLTGSGIDTDRGVFVNNFLETNVPDVYAIGDCVQHKTPPTGRRNLEQVWYTGRIMGETVAETITGTRIQYRPGNWFNSAKFFDLEYQTYGIVNAIPGDDEDTLFFKDKKKGYAVRLNFLKHNRQLKGVNTLGLRLRHDVIDRWITENVTVDAFLNNLNMALFDPELYPSPNLQNL